MVENKDLKARQQAISNVVDKVMADFDKETDRDPMDMIYKKFL